MKTEDGADGGLDKLGELIEEVEVAMLTTHAADGSMVSRPLQTLKYRGNGELVFFTGAASHKQDELRAHPDVNIAYANPSKQVYVSVRGEASLDRDRATIDELWSPAFNIYFEGGRDDPDLEVLRVRIRDAGFWEASGNFVGRAIDFARAAMSHDPGQMGKHGRISGNA
jgi:general stress protein 26